jgi:hypothetical protein
MSLVQRHILGHHGAAGVAAFARTLCQLMALGAPLELLERSQIALSDEIDHTRGSLAWLARFGGGEAVPGALSEAVSPLGSSAAVGLEQLARELLLDVVRRSVGPLFEATGLSARLVA